MMFGLLMMFGMLAFALVVVFFILAMVRGASRNRPDPRAPRLRADARVVDKRSEISGGGETRAVQHYYVTFQFPDGNRIELEASGPESGLLTPGDTGSLEWQGAHFVGFAREILR
ncbi:MAG: DUF2500 domain-containing protein [Propionicimonas sp.]|nr:DUF2500 domain-containing protein [Propionicimonas sp.]